MEQNVRRFIEHFYIENYQRLYIFAFSILHQKADAEAAVQEAFLAACKKADEFIKSENHIGWLKKAVENEALHILRERNYTAALFLSIEELSAGQEPAALDSTCFELLDLCQGAVSKEQFDFFLRIARHESTFPEEASRQGIKLSACYKRFERIREKLKQALENYHKM